MVASLEVSITIVKQKRPLYKEQPSITEYLKNASYCGRP